MKNQYDSFFNGLAVITFVMALFCVGALPFVFDTEEAAASVLRQNVSASEALEGTANGLILPEVSRYIEIKENRDTASVNIANAEELITIALSVKPIRHLVKLKYAGVFYCTKYAATLEQCGSTAGITASGKKVTTDPTCWTVAVDPKIIPLGTKLKIDLPGYEDIVFEATDTGSAINNYDVDVFTESEAESKNFNPCYVDVWIIED